MNIYQHGVTYLRLTITLVAMTITAWISAAAQDQNPCTSPPPSNTYWAKNSNIGIYMESGLDPNGKDNFTGTEFRAMRQAVENLRPMAQSYGITFSELREDPGNGNSATAVPNTIRIMNDPAESPNNFALSRPYTYKNADGTPSNRLFSLTIPFNKGYIKKGTAADGSSITYPAYDPEDPESAYKFFVRIIMHEITHGWAKDAVVPNNNPCMATSLGIMNGYCGTNDTGVIDGFHIAKPSMPDTLTPCDRQTIDNMESTKGGRCSVPRSFTVSNGLLMLQSATESGCDVEPSIPPSDPGTGDPGTGDPGTGDPGTDDPGTGNPSCGVVSSSYCATTEAGGESCTTCYETELDTCTGASVETQVGDEECDQEDVCDKWTL